MVATLRSTSLAATTLLFCRSGVLAALALPGSAHHWSGRTIQVKLIKINARVIHHARQIIFRTAEAAVAQGLFAQILRHVGELSPGRG